MQSSTLVNEGKRAYGWRMEAEALNWFSSRFPDAVLLERNFQAKVGELDLIFEMGNELVIVEVRVRDPRGMETPIESVGFSKQRKLIRTIEFYLTHYEGSAETVRLDLVAWNGFEWEHWPNLWGLFGQR